MTDAIIGRTGFGGGLLDRQHAFGARFNSATIGDIAGRSYDSVVCAAAPGSMFMANRMPEQDRAQIDALIRQLEGLRARRFVLISSIAVLEDFAGGDDETTDAFQHRLAYGRHRRLLETFCDAHFASCLTVRLPALFGPGLRKNFLFDLLNPVPSMLSEERLDALLTDLGSSLRAVAARLYLQDEQSGLFRLDRRALDTGRDRPALDAAVLEAGRSSTQFHNRLSTYQYYDMARLWRDITTASEAGLRCVHLVTEPLQSGEIHRRLLRREMPQTSAPLHCEDMHTRHAGLWGREGPYLEDGTEVLDKLEAFFNHQRQAAP